MYVVFKFIKLPIDETQQTSLNKTPNQKEKEKKHVERTQDLIKKQNPKWVTKGKGTIMFQSPTNDMKHIKEKKNMKK